jgi:hypothetical protein
MERSPKTLLKTAPSLIADGASLLTGKPIQGDQQQREDPKQVIKSFLQEASDQHSSGITEQKDSPDQQRHKQEQRDDGISKSLVGKKVSELRTMKNIANKPSNRIFRSNFESFLVCLNFILACCILTTLLMAFWVGVTVGPIQAVTSSEISTVLRDVMDVVARWAVGLFHEANI